MCGSNENYGINLDTALVDTKTITAAVAVAVMTSNILVNIKAEPMPAVMIIRNTSNTMLSTMVIKKARQRIKV